MPAPSRSATLLLLATVAVVAAAFGTHVAARPGPADTFHSLADEALLYPLALKSAEQDLYPRDDWLADAERIFSRLYSHLLGPFLVDADHPARVAWALSILPRVLFLIGAVLLALRWTRSPLAGILFAGALLLPGARDWSVSPGQALPRDFVFALLPYALLALPTDARPAVPRAATSAFVLGLSANLHPLTALHVLMLAGPAFVLFTGRGRLRTALVQAPSFALGALPYILEFAAAPRAGWGSPEALAARVPDLVSFPVSAAAATFGPIALLLAAPACGRLPGLAAPRRVAALLALAAVLALPCGWLSTRIPWLTQFQFLRATRMLGFLALLPAAALVASLTGHRALRASRLFAAITVVLLLLTVAGQRSLFDRAGRRVFGRSPPAAPPAPSRPRGGELAGRPAADRAAFLAFADRCRRETPRNALFLVPPEDLSTFRLHARRSIVVDRKSGGFAVTLLGAKGLEWLAQYREVVALYARKDADALLDYCRERRVDYIVAELPCDEFALPVAFREGPFVLHPVPPP